MQQQIALDDIANANAAIAVESHEALADDLRTLDAAAWNAPTACSEWTIRDLTEHVAGVASMFSREARRAVAGSSPTPAWAGDDGVDAAEMDTLPPGAKVVAYIRRRGLDTLPAAELIDAMIRDVHDFQTTIEGADVGRLQQPATVPFGQFPLFILANMLAIEGAIHHWDAGARRQSDATIRSQWATPLALGVSNWMPYIASTEGATNAGGTYLLQVGDGIGPVTVSVRDGQVQGEHSATGSPDAILHLTPDQYIRLAFGRLDVAREQSAGNLPIEGDLARAAQLNRVFQGI